MGYIFEGVGLPHPRTQRSRIRAYAQNNNGELLAVHTDRRPDDRRGFEKALEQAARRGATLTVHSLPILLRDDFDVRCLGRDLSGSEARLASLKEGIDLDSELFLLLEFLTDLPVGAIEETTVVDPFPEQRVPFGFDFKEEQHRVVENKGEQKIVRLMRLLRVGGLSLRQIADELDERGIRPKYGRRWSASAISTILNRRVAHRGRHEEKN